MTESSSMSSSSVIALALLFAGCATAGVATALIADASTWTLALLLAQPVALTLAIGGVFASLVTRQVELAAGIAVAATLLLAPVHLWPGRPLPALPKAAAPLDDLIDRCLADAGPAPGRGIRIAAWNTQGRGEPADARRVAAQIDADILLLSEVHDPEYVHAIARHWGGQGAWTFNGAGRGVAVIARDAHILPCFPGDETLHPIDLPAGAGRNAIAALAFVRLQGGGTLPVVVVHTDRPETLEEWMSWPQLLRGSSQRIAALASRIRHPGLVVAGDTNTDATFRRFNARIASAGLRMAPAEATWPDHFYGLPLPAAYSLDRAWYGDAWRLAQRDAIEGPLPSDHLMIVVDLLPR